MSLLAKVSGTYRNPHSWYVKRGSSQTKLKQLWGKVGGTYRLLYGLFTAMMTSPQGFYAQEFIVGGQTTQAGFLANMEVQGVGPFTYQWSKVSQSPATPVVSGLSGTGSSVFVSITQNFFAYVTVNMRCVVTDTATGEKITVNQSGILNLETFD